MDYPDRFVMSCTRSPERVAQIRRISAAHLRLWGLGECVETATLLISELVTNAVRYGERDEISFSLSHLKGEVRIDAGDGSPGHPRVKRPASYEETGRGMLIVDTLADEWGTTDDGSRTWATIAAPAPMRITPGFWCEWRGADGERLAACASPQPTSAISWARTQMRVIASTIGEPLLADLWDWLSDGWRDATAALERGEDFTLPLVAGPHAFVWHARPVRFLPMALAAPEGSACQCCVTG
ncbi:ATP-binding protein [Streptomyces sp. NPDC059850]|uniref:ATP-binding protein n=1 Tax=Streptomyces sp. NPDC059850 TaxID=3346970 RepID=UPI003652C152